MDIHLASYVLIAELQVEGPIGTIRLQYHSSYRGFVISMGESHIHTYAAMKQKFARIVGEKFPNCYDAAQIQRIYRKLRTIMRRMANAKLTLTTE